MFKEWWMRRKVGIEFETSPEKFAALEKLREDAQVPTKKELFNNALTLLEWAIKEREAGNNIVSLDEHTGDRRVLRMPILETAANKPRNVNK